MQLELGQIQAHMAHKPVRLGVGVVSLCGLWPLMAGSGWSAFFFVVRGAPPRGCSARHRRSWVGKLRGVSVPLQVEAVHDFVHVYCWSVLVWKAAFRPAISAVRCAMCLLLSSGITLMSPLGLRANGVGCAFQFQKYCATHPPTPEFCSNAGV